MDQRTKQLKNRIMRGVYWMWFTRTILPALVLELSFFVVVLIGTRSYMSLANVWENATVRATAYPLAAFGRFWLEALSNSELTLKLLLGAALLLSAVLARDTMRVSRRLRGNFLRFSRVT